MGSIFESVEHKRVYPANVFVVNLESSRLHWHYDYELMVILRGSLQVFCGPEPYILRGGDIVLFNSRVIHGLKHTDEDNLCLFIQFPPSLFDPVLDHQQEYYFYLNSTEKNFTPRKPYEHFTKLAVNIGISGRQHGVTADLRTHALIQTLIADLVEYAEFDIHSGHHTNGIDSIGKLISNVCLYIDNNIQDGNLAESTIKHFKINKKTLYRYLKETIGQSLKGLIDAARIEKSKQLLRESNKPPVIIADECGFYSEVTFYRVFKKETGITPREFRRGGSSLLMAPGVKGYLNSDEHIIANLLYQYAENVDISHIVQ
ncbi:MAG: AraC family transcriptional regulator [Spirochaetaceae bacterium]|jgi:AraC-like DNA-binding protein|nr:AraC family transcriptional regulator [Spirochaetaceae bacterium]